MRQGGSGRGGGNSSSSRRARSIPSPSSSLASPRVKAVKPTCAALGPKGGQPRPLRWKEGTASQCQPVAQPPGRAGQVVGSFLAPCPDAGWAAARHDPKDREDSERGVGGEGSELQTVRKCSNTRKSMHA